MTRSDTIIVIAAVALIAGPPLAAVIAMAVHIFRRGRT